jgi:hypothetical protein
MAKDKWTLVTGPGCGVVYHAASFGVRAASRETRDADGAPQDDELETGTEGAASSAPTKHRETARARRNCRINL